MIVPEQLLSLLKTKLAVGLGLMVTATGPTVSGGVPLSTTV